MLSQNSFHLDLIRNPILRIYCKKNKTKTNRIACLLILSIVNKTWKYLSVQKESFAMFYKIFDVYDIVEKL